MTEIQHLSFDSNAPVRVTGLTRQDKVSIYLAAAEALYPRLPAPVCIISDGPYGVSGYPGDMPEPGRLADWYRPHALAWADAATPQTTLWFWNTEVGWANMHPVLLDSGWDYGGCNVWDKGMGHIAGNVNTKTLRRFPPVTEVCAQYSKRVLFPSPQGGPDMTMRDWLRAEWLRSGLPLNRANTACGVANAATRKYLTADHMWYCPPPDAFTALAAYANAHGRPSGRPYFSLTGETPVKREQWATIWSRYRAKFTCPYGVTNVWRKAQVGGKERLPAPHGKRSSSRYKSLHGSQKPLDIIEMIITASTDIGDVVWEPFGGLCPAAVAALALDRECHSMEINSDFHHAAGQRLKRAHETL